MPKYPKAKARFTGADGNVFNLIAICVRALEKVKAPENEIETFKSEVMRTKSYDDAMQYMMGWVNVT